MTDIFRAKAVSIFYLLRNMMKFLSVFRNKFLAVSLVTICIAFIVYQIVDSPLSIQDSIARRLEAVTSWVRDKPHAGETISSAVRDSLETSAPTVQLTSRPVSSDCKQMNRLTSATALVIFAWSLDWS